MWPKQPTIWIENRVAFISIPFTWNLPEARMYLLQRHAAWETAVVGGPAVELMPSYFKDLGFVTIGMSSPGILQRVNPLATRTTTGCIRTCRFCGIGTGSIESGGFRELNDWPDLPIVCDNNLLAASMAHFDRVMDRLERHIAPDFNQGLDSRLFTDYHAGRLARLHKPAIRLSLDSMPCAGDWECAFERLLRAGCKRSSISSYALIGYDSDPVEAWDRCRWIEAFKIKAYPMWFHALNAMRLNEVTRLQKTLGWTEKERLRIMGYFYQHRRSNTNRGGRRD